MRKSYRSIQLHNYSITQFANGFFPSRPHCRSHASLPAALRLLLESDAIVRGKRRTFDGGMDQRLSTSREIRDAACALHRRRTAGSLRSDRTDRCSARCGTLYESHYLGHWIERAAPAVSSRGGT